VPERWPVGPTPRSKSPTERIILSKPIAIQSFKTFGLEQQACFSLSGANWLKKLVKIVKSICLAPNDLRWLYDIERQARCGSKAEQSEKLTSLKLELCHTRLSKKLFAFWFSKESVFKPGIDFHVADLHLGDHFVFLHCPK